MKMRRIALVGVVALALVSCNETAKKEVEVEEVEVGESFGPTKVDINKAMSVEEMLADFSTKTKETEYTFEGKITEVCSKAGCWINVDKGNGETFMVRFKDHFTIPTDTKLNSNAYLHGIAYWDTVSVEMLQHFAEDAGKSEEEISKITEAKYELGFEADGITLKK